eukprot:TRINITY_DN9581_c0_g1_i5.p1 TRINITY_DN9581_c0_g1~~TRINITY_DN9581_c0_g1_i5.p1  ORF type:complete len:489 (-),score=73.15 TRINITY_DN9581_c0_g1_i5:18-1484(-)
MQKVSVLVLRANNIILRNEEERCSEWDLRIIYTFEGFTKIKASIDARSYQCQAANPLPNELKAKKNAYARKNSCYVYSLSLLICSLLGLYFSWKKAYETSINYKTTQYYIRKKALKNIAKVERSNSRPIERTRSEGFDDSFTSRRSEREKLEDILKKDQPWENLSLSERLRFFDLWLFVSMLGNTFQLFGSLLNLFEFVPLNTTTYTTLEDFFLGLGCFAAWIKLASYLEYNNRNAYLLTTTIKYAFPSIAKFIFGILPIILGYIFLGRCLFWKTSGFESATSSFVTLFSSMVGDNIRTGFVNTNSDGMIAKIFLYSFDILFICAVHNMFISIICDAFEEQRADRGLGVGHSLVQKRKSIAWQKFEQDYLDPKKIMPNESESPKKKRTKEDVIEFFVSIHTKAQGFEADQGSGEMEAHKNSVLRNFNDFSADIEELLTEMDVIIRDSKFFIREKTEMSGLRSTYVVCAGMLASRLSEFLAEVRNDKKI